MAEELSYILNLRRNYQFVSYLLVFCMCTVSVLCDNECKDINCSGNGVCSNGSCICDDGWQGPSCQFCGGKVRLSEPTGTIHDGGGNYSTDIKCSWLIEAGVGSSIRFRLEEFATECGWDHLYVFDGDSVASPILAVFSGLMYKDKYGIRRIPEIVAKSGTAFLYFYSDSAFNMTGFNITYKINTCPSLFSNATCSGHGYCLDGVCHCDEMYEGEGCEISICPNKCSYPKGVCSSERKGCICNPQYKGDDCSQLAREGYWEAVQYNKDSLTPKGSASHGAVVFSDTLFVIGGESFGQGEMMYTYNFSRNVWENLYNLENEIILYPSLRYGHSVVLFGNKIYMYGGVTEGGWVSNDLWAFDTLTHKWKNIPVENCSPYSPNCRLLQIAGHTATVFKGKGTDRMVVIFGHSPTLGYLNLVQEFHFGSGEWHIVETRGHPVKGGYGHTSALDPYTEKIYVYGGFKSDEKYNPLLTDHLYSYDPNTKWWTLLLPGPSARYLHTATFLRGGLMLIFGGNTHNDTVHSYGAKCYSGDMLAYDVKCNSWQVMQIPPHLRADLARFGHSAVIFKEELYFYGGFDGIMRNDMIKFGAGSCETSNMSACIRGGNGIKCVWNPVNETCISIMEIPPSLITNDNKVSYHGQFIGCARSPSTVQLGHQECSQQTDCLGCLTTSFSCEFCDDTCVNADSCRKNALNWVDREKSVLRSPEQCPASADPICAQLSSCTSCLNNPSCIWSEERCRALLNTTFDESFREFIRCPEPCSELTSCQTCTEGECIWCQNEGRCVDKNAYKVSFPYGQCRQWTTNYSLCQSDKPGKPDCEFYRTCSECQSDPECGWCNDASETGLGVCMPGGSHAPFTPSRFKGGGYCPKERWFFTTCPSCQCNGHATCLYDSHKCDECANNTTGEHCDRCKEGYFGSPVNGGVCARCKCLKPGVMCNSETGQCLCTTKGEMGDLCEKCDTSNHFSVDPVNPKTCFYDLVINYQFTFNLSRTSDRYYNQINYRSSPKEKDIDVHFSIICTRNAKMNLTMKTVGNPERTLFTAVNCSEFRSIFTASENNFGSVDNVPQTTFYVYVYNLKSNLSAKWIVVSFTQMPHDHHEHQDFDTSTGQHFDTSSHQHFNYYALFMWVFLALIIVVIIAAVLWKIKQKYNLYRKHRLMYGKQRAPRPSSQDLIEEDDDSETTPQLGPSIANSEAN